MKVIRDGLWLCQDCLFCAVNDDVTAIEDGARVIAVEAGVAGLGPNLVSDFDSESGDGIRDFSSVPCDSCSTRLAGDRHRFAILGEDEGYVTLCCWGQPGSCKQPATRNGRCKSHTPTED